MTRVVCWNIAARQQPWTELLEMDADVALLQEVGAIPSSLPADVELEPGELSDPWNPDAYNRWPAVAKLSDRVRMEWFRRIFPYSSTSEDTMAVSGIGTIAAARVIPQSSTPFIAISMYARWIRPHVSTKTSWTVGNSDVSAHRIISDLSQFIGHHNPSKHRILAAGDLNTFYGATDDNKLCIADRERTVFDRMSTLGMEFMGPQHPDGGRVAEPTPQGLPKDTRNVPTYYTVQAGSPEKAQNQLDYVFASRGFHNSLRVRALNEPKEWGSSDHCRILIEIE